jgi:RNA polymerase sigma-70 factor (ECF subfamily)
VQADVQTALRAARDGDVAGFNVLVRLHQRQVYNICYRTLGNTEDAADATQDAFLSAFRGLGSFRGSADGFHSWLLRVAVNACYDQLRRRKRRPVDSLDRVSAELDSTNGPTPAARLVDPEAGPEQRVLSAETAHHIQQALSHLSAEQRLAVVLCDVQGLSYEEAAHVMQVELGTVKSRLSRARSQLRDLLGARGERPAAARRLEQ